MKIASVCAGIIFTAIFSLIPRAEVVHAQSWPAKPVRIVVPYPAGGTTDLVARLLADALTKAYGQQFLVENRSGAGANIGAAFVAKASPDGYTLLVTSPGPLTTNQFLYKTLPFDPGKDFVPVASLCDAPMVIAAKRKLPIKTLKELIDYARANPGKLSYASPGNGTLGYLTGELFKQMTGIQIVHVPYRGSAPALRDLLGDVVDLSTDVLPIYIPHIVSGDVNALAVTTAQRWFALEGVPTMAEAGVPGYEVSAWIALFGPAGLSVDIVGPLNHRINEYLRSEEGARQLRDLGYRPLGGTPADLERIVHSDVARWGSLLNSIAGARLD